jgi:predicted metal-dependent peptidase
MTAGDNSQLQQRRISATQVRLALSQPFFAALMLMAPIDITDSVDTAATDGMRLMFNPKFIGALTSNELAGLVVHEVLHCALAHVPRRGLRDPLLWNIAADIHVNGLIRKDNRLQLPAGAVIDEKLEHLAVEEIYAVLERTMPKWTLSLVDLLPMPSGMGGEGRSPSEEMEAHWKGALHRALAAAQVAGRGNLPADLLRAVRAATEPTIDWRSVLWRWMVRTPDDFMGYDRRMVWQGLYMEELAGESVRADVCVDTSGSVDDEMLGQLLAELRGIMRSYPSVRCRLWYADDACHGPYELDGDLPTRAPVGGGGTDFRPFFRAVASDDAPGNMLLRHTPPLLIYLTDGEGEFPEHAPESPVLWAVTPGGRASEDFPFGAVVRMT